ncbi:MAG TPA: zinc-dependent alcohol dehydrogenase family protein [Terriglobales bacterium]|nr:zinc-dependent alcohol dehydrogenase family protein [Terriglobales bacterium]
MKVMAINRFGGPEVLELQEIPIPKPGPKQVLVKVHATSVNPVDYKIRQGTSRFPVKLPLVLGGDVSGVVEELGPGVTDFKVGDEVYYSPGLGAGPGSYAEYNVTREEIVSFKPESLTHFEAASIPLAGGTAWDGLITRGKIQLGESVLIHAGAGGVGSLAIQIAKAAGAYVFTTCRSTNFDLVKSLGADCAIDYHSQDYTEVILKETKGKGVDLVYDTVGGDTMSKCVGLMKPYGRMVSIVNTTDSLNSAYMKNLTVHFEMSPRYRFKLDALRTLLERKQIKPVIDSILPLSQVAEAHRRLEQRGVRGKIVLDPSK